MNKTVMNDLTLSSNRFEQIIKPRIAKILKGEFLIVEGQTTDKMKLILDQLSGIDSWHIDFERGLRGIASRIQIIDDIKFPNAKSFNTFTIRKQRESGVLTEFEKRKYAIKNGYLYPFYTVHAYIRKSNNNLMTCAIAKTKDIIEYIDKGYSAVNGTNKEQVGQATFYVVYWNEFARKGYKIYSWQTKK